MTAEEFLEKIGEAEYYRDKGKARLNRAKRHYAAYMKAYQENSLCALVFSAKISGSEWSGIHAAAEDRDAGLPMCYVPELME